MSSPAKLLIGLGIVLIIAGVVVYVLDKAGIHLGNLPGDVQVNRGNVRFYFPIMTSIVVSIVLSVVLWLVNRFSK